MPNKLSLVVPTYNEAGNIAQLCSQLAKVLDGEDYEIIIVDDDSPDGTWRIAEDLASKVNNIKVIRRTNQRGLATAVVTGWQSAQGDILGVIDADLQHPPEVLPSLLKVILNDREVDLVIASRHISGGGVSRWSILRRMISRAATLLAAFFLPELLSKVKDPMSGYFILRKKVLEGVILEPEGYKILLEVLAKGRYSRVYEFPYVFVEREKGGSKAGVGEYLRSMLFFIKLSFRTRQILIVVRNIISILVFAIIAFSLYAVFMYINRVKL